MCFRVTIIMPSNSKINSVREISRQHGFYFDRIDNPYVLNQLSENEIYLGDAQNGCECYTGIGAYELYIRDINKALDTLDNEWLREKMKEEENERKKKYESEVNKWLVLLKILINDFSFSRIGILLHFYHNSSQNEEISIKDKIYNKLDQIDSEFLMKIEKDIIYYFC